MRAWSDEWRCARLRLHLRSEQLFQGETVNVQVFADVRPAPGGSTAPNNEHKGQPASPHLLQRWREHCEGAHVQIQVVKVADPDPHASSPSASSTTLFRQETQFSHVSVGRLEDGTGYVVKLKAQFDLNLRRECWDREVLLVVHITPKNEVVGVGNESTSSEDWSGRKGSLGVSVLRNEWASAELLSLTREEAQPTPMMTRRVEQRIVVTKPLQLQVETRELTGQRVGILARASNAHPTLALTVRDLHLHLDQSFRASSRAVNRFRVVSGDKVPFPVVLLPQERHNFLFVLEPVEFAVADVSLESPERGGCCKLATARSSTQRKGKLDHGSAAPAAQHTLLTLSWQAETVSMEAITENRTIVWSLEAPSRQFATSDENESQQGMEKLLPYVLAGQGVKRGGKPHADFKCARLLPDSELHATIAPLSSSIAVANAVTVCVTVANRSAHCEFDLTLALPSHIEGLLDTSSGKKDLLAPAVVGFEASHRLGLLRPGMSVRKSLHVAFLRLGKSKLGPLVLVDHLTHTCFVTDDWEVFIKL